MKKKEPIELRPKKTKITTHFIKFINAGLFLPLPERHQQLSGAKMDL